MSIPDPDKYLYNTINNGLLRMRKTGSFSNKRIKKEQTGSFVSFDELSDYEFDAEDFFGDTSPIEFLKEDEGGEPQDHGDTDKIERRPDGTWSLTPEQIDKALAKHFEAIRVESYEDINEHRERRGLQPWYVLTKEELNLVGLCIPYGLAINPHQLYVKETIREEGQRIKELKAKGIPVKPWATWKEDH